MLVAANFYLLAFHEFKNLRRNMLSMQGKARLALARIEDAAMDPMKTVISLIPDVKPWLAMKALHAAMRDQTHGAEDLSPEDRSFIWRQDYGRKTSPIGGRILVNLFRDGMIPQNRPASQDISALIAYSDGVEDFRVKLRQAIAEYQLHEKQSA